MDVLTVYLEILDLYVEKVGIYPILQKPVPQSIPAAEPVVPDAPKTLYTRTPEPQGRRQFAKPIITDQKVIDDIRTRIISRRRTRFTKEGVFEIPSVKLKN
jgi:hypothetical protein